MIVVHIEAGLGNQMMDYAEYYIIKRENPHQECYIENVLYDIEECSSIVSMWNGYELDRIFSLNTLNENISSTFRLDYQLFVDSVRKSEFWLKDWSYPSAVIKALKNITGKRFINCCNGGWDFLKNGL